MFLSSRTSLEVRDLQLSSTAKSFFISLFSRGKRLLLNLGVP